MLRILREPRYAALSLLMLLAAAMCVAAGTWQIARLHGKAGTNASLRGNARDPAVPVAALLPLAGQAPTPRPDSIQFRTVTATGSYDPTHAALVRQRTVGGDTGYLVLTPLRTGDGTLLVVRGFLSATHSAGGTPPVPAPPTGRVQVTGRAEPGETRSDAASRLPDHQVESINPQLQGARLGTPVFAGYADLVAGQPGSAGLTPIPAPDLSNPAGGAVEPQHLAYIIQWYLFALLALAAPWVIARAETGRGAGARSDELADTVAPPAARDRERAAKLADRYGRVVR